MYVHSKTDCQRVLSSAWNQNKKQKQNAKLEIKTDRLRRDDNGKSLGSQSRGKKRVHTRYEGLVKKVVLAGTAK